MITLIRSRNTLIALLYLLPAIVLGSPEVPTPLSPLSEASTSAPQFTWQHQPTSLKYVLMVVDRSTGERVHWKVHQAVDICADNQCSLTPDINLGFSNQHVWFVRSWNSTGASAWAKTVFAFKDELPSIPSPIAPTVTTQTSQPEFSWTHQTGALRYVLLVVDRSTGERVHWKAHQAEDICDDYQCSFTPDINLDFSNQHVWNVKSWNYTGSSTWAKSVFSFKDDPPSIPEPLLPIATTESLQPEFQWSNITEASGYVFLLHDVTNNNRLLWKAYNSEDICSNLSCSVETSIYLEHDNQYVWYVRAKHSTGTSAWTKTFFSTIPETNYPPTTLPDTATVTRGDSVVIDVLANDSDEDNLDASSVSIASQALYGMLTIENGSVKYTHNGGTDNTDSFEYTVADSQGAQSAPSLVTITIEDDSQKIANPSDITDLILVTGQSNVRGSQTGYDSTLDTIDLRVFAYTNNNDWEVADLHQAWDVDGWHPGNGSLEPYCLADPLCVPRQPYNNFAFHFAKTVVENDPDRVVGIIIAGAPGEGISHWDQSNAFAQTLESKVVAALNAQGVKAQLDGILWHQGETDWQIEGTSDADASDFEKSYPTYYPDKLNNLIERFRAKSWFGFDKPFICGETKQAPVNQRLVALESDNNPWTGCVHATDLPTLEMDLTTTPPTPGTHFDANGLRTLGERYGLKYLEMTAQ